MHRRAFLKKALLKFIEKGITFFFSRSDGLETYKKLEFNIRPVIADRDVLES
jgi:hypothetical protein